ncbi:MAG: PAS domain-containing protein, partial [Bdellovibrionota bacterium]
MVATDAKLLRGITASVIDAVFETSPDWVFVKDLDHRFQYGNPTFLRFLGLTLEEVIGKTSPELGFTTHVVRHGSKPDETGLWADDEEVISSGKAQTFRGKSLYWRGEWVYFNTDKFP